MVIKLVFTTQRETFNLRIVGREIFYADRIWKSDIRLIPKDEGFFRKIALGRNRFPNIRADIFVNLFEPTPEEQLEYDNAKTEAELADICIKDIRKKGGVLRKRTCENYD